MRIQILSLRVAGLLAVVVLILSSCTNLKKATTYLDKNRVEAAKYCISRFPIIEKVDTLYMQDSTDYDTVFNELLRYSDSLLNELDKKPAGEKIDVDSLRKVLTLQIREKVKPCIDNIKVVEKTVIDTRQLEVANGVIGDLEKELNGKDEVISKRDARISQLEEKINGLRKALWIGWGLFICLAVWCNRKLLVRLITKLPL